jgi:hypothetical protein
MSAKVGFPTRWRATEHLGESAYANNPERGFERI